ncbi:MAG TPA: hypothetical protein PKB03_07375, partial [Baekduia sp.]|nr:hypothetical protein [Baekduia sp.]
MTDVVDAYASETWQLIAPDAAVDMAAVVRVDRRRAAPVFAAHSQDAGPANHASRLLGTAAPRVIDRPTACTIGALDSDRFPLAGALAPM